MTRSRPRQAFTLLEILLVLAILIILLGVSYPTLSGMYGDVKARAAADQVRGACIEARAKAIEDGRAYRFAVQNETGEFRVAPDNSFLAGEGVGEDDAPALVIEGTLAGEIIFEFQNETTTEGAWSTVAVFNPDGTCSSTIEITLRDHEDAGSFIVKIRAMTGAVTVRRKVGE